MVIDNPGWDETLVRLREAADYVAPQPEPHQVSAIVDLLVDARHDPDAIGRITGLGEQFTLDIIAGFGEFLGQSSGQTADVQIVSIKDAPHPVAEIPTGKARRTFTPGQLDLWPTHTDDIVVVPPGFEIRYTKRELRKAIRNIVTSRPGEPEIRRWLLRRGHRVHQNLVFPTVAMVHCVSQLGRLGELDELVYTQRGVRSELARVIVAAYDLLDVTRADAVRSIDALADGATDFAAHCVRASVLAEAAVGRLRSGLATGNARLAAKALGRFRQEIADGGNRFRPADVSELNVGQVRRIAERAGLELEAPTYAEEGRVRAWIEESGQALEVELLLPDGVRAVHYGLGDVFKASLARRAEGDLTWSDQLNGALATVS